MDLNECLLDCDQSMRLAGVRRLSSAGKDPAVVGPVHSDFRLADRLAKTSFQERSGFFTRPARISRQLRHLTIMGLANQLFGAAEMRAVNASAGRSLSQYSQFGRGCSAMGPSITDEDITAGH
jgi:hypothetical protein